MDVARGVTSRVTATPGNERDPVWAPDSRSLAFIARTEKDASLRRKGLRASDPETVCRVRGGSRRIHPGVLAAKRRDAPGAAAEPAEGRADGVGHAPERRKVGAGAERGPLRRAPAVARRALARLPVERVRAGRSLRRAVPPRRRPRPRLRDGRRPAEVASGRPGTLLHHARQPSDGGRGARAGERLDVSLPAELFEIRGLEAADDDDYAPSADGQRFLVKVPIEQDRKPTLNVVTNWTSLLR